MGFFELPPPSEPPDEEEWAQPVWSGPPEGVLGGVVPIQLVLARTDSTLLAATHIAVYPTGVGFRLVGLMRHVAPHRHPGLHRWDEEEIGTRLRVGVLYPDGRSATNLGQPWPSGDEDPAGPVLVGQGGGGGGRSFEQDYWVWPLPGPGPLVLVVEWPGRSVPESRAQIPGHLLQEARARILEAWPGPPAAGGYTSVRTMISKPEDPDPGDDPA